MKPTFKLEPDNRHTAPFVLLAHVSYVDKNGKTIRQSKIQIARCFSVKEAKKFIAETKKSVIVKQDGYNKDGPVFIERFGKPRQYSSFNPSGGVLTEQIDDFSIVEKDVYLNSVK